MMDTKKDHGGHHGPDESPVLRSDRAEVEDTPPCGGMTTALLNLVGLIEHNALDGVYKQNPEYFSTILTDVRALRRMITGGAT